MESKIQLEPHFMNNYEQWLEDEVWSYFDWEIQGRVEKTFPILLKNNGIESGVNIIWYEKSWLNDLTLNNS